MKTKNRKDKKYISNRISDKRLGVASILGFLFGAFGIHDFITGRHGRGIAHIILCVIAAIIAPFCLFLAGMSSDAGCYNMSLEMRIFAHALLYTPFVIIMISHIWAMIESINFLKTARFRIDTSMLPAVQKESLRRENLDYMIIDVIIAIIIGVPLVILLSSTIISIFNCS